MFMNSLKCKGSFNVLSVLSTITEGCEQWRMFVSESWLKSMNHIFPLNPCSVDGTKLQLSPIAEDFADK